MATVTISDALASRLHAFAEQEHTSVEAILEQCLGAHPSHAEPVKPDAAQQNQHETILHANLYRAVVESMDEGVIVRRPDATVVDCNASALKILDMSRERLFEVGGIETDWQVIHSDGTQMLSENTPSAIANQTGQPQHNVIICAIKPNATELWLSINTHPIFLTDSVVPDYVVSIFSDITAFRHATKQAEKSAAYWQYISDLAFEGIAITDKGVMQDANNRLLEITGYTREELFGIPSAALVHPQDREHVRRKAIENTDLPYHHRLLRKDGTVIPVEIQTKLLNNGLRVTAVRDISKQHQIEQELEKTRALLQAAIEQSPAGIIIADVPDVEIQWVNQTALKIQGYNPIPKLERTQYHDLSSWRTFYPDGTPYPIDESPLMRAAFGEEIYAEEMLNENRRWVLVNAAPIRNVDGDIVASIAVFSDITERKQAENALRRSEERYRNLLESAPLAIGVIRFDEQQEARYVYVNPALVRLFRAQSAAEIVGRSIMDFSPQEDREGLQKRANAYRSGEPRVAPTELRIECFDGTLAYIEVSSLAIEFENTSAVMSVMIDITEKHTTEVALRRSEERYRNLLEFAPIPLIVSQIDTDGIATIIYANTACANLFKVTAAQHLLGKRLVDFEPPSEHPKSIERAKALEQGQLLPTAEYTMQPLSSSPRHITVGSIPIDYQGEPAVMSVLVDVTERHEAEMALRESEARYRNLLESSPSAMIVNRIEADNRLRVVYVNPAALRLFKTDNAVDIIGRDNTEHIVADYHSLSYQRTEALLRGELLEAAEYKLRRMDGTEIVTLVGSILIDYEGHPAFLSVYSDITERKQTELALRQSEDRYRRMLENAPVGIFVVRMDDKATVRYVNPTGAAILAAEPETIIGRSSFDLMPPESLDLMRNRIENLTSGNTNPAREYALKRSDGQLVHVRASAIPITYDNEPSSLTVLIDVSERYQAEVALRRRDAIMGAVAYAAEQFLRNRTLESSLQPVLARLGQATEIERAYVFEHYDGVNGKTYINQIAEWVAEGITPQIDNPKLQHIERYSEGWVEWDKAIDEGRVVSQHVKDFIPSVQVFLTEQDILSIVAAPILIGQRVWGYIGLDSCREEREWSPSEMNALKAAAETLAAAIERKRDEEALRASEERLRLALNSTGTGIWEWDLPSNSVRWSEGVEPIFGLEAGMFAGTYDAYLNLIHPDDYDMVVTTINTSLNHADGQYYVEHRTLSPDKQLNWIEAKGVVLRDDNGHPLRMLGIIENVTARKAAQVALQEREARINRQNDALIQLATVKALGTGDLDTALREITCTTSETMNIARVSIWFYIEEDSAISCELLYNAFTEDYESGFVLREAQYPAYFHALRQNRVIAADDTYTDAATHEFAADYLAAHSITSLLDAPIRIGGKTVGVVCNEHVGTPRQWTYDDQHFVSGVADLVALAIESRDRQVAEAALRHSEETALEFQNKLRKVHDVTLQLSQEATLTDIYRRAVELGRSELGFDRMGLFLIDEAHSLARGTFGTDDSGQLRDEHLYSSPLVDNPNVMVVVRSKERAALSLNKPLRDIGEVVGKGWSAIAVLWNGSEGIGWLVIDNLLSQQPPRPYELDLLTVYGTALGSLITQCQAEETALEFQNKLRQIHEIAVELSQQKTLLDIYRQAIELGRSKLGFERLGLWLIEDDTAYGTFGIDETGQLRDETHHSHPISDDRAMFDASQSKQRTVFNPQIDIKDHQLQSVGSGWNAATFLWDGQRDIGWFSTDAFLTKRIPRPYELDLLTVYGTSLAHLITQRRTQDALRLSEETALAFQERLRTVHDITLELSQQELLVDVYRLAVELGRSKLGFDRLGLWVLNGNRDTIIGTFGTDNNGQLSDEHHLSFPLNQLLPEVLEVFNRKERILTQETGGIVKDAIYEVDTTGWNVVATLWNGSEGIGWISADNYLHKAEPRPYEFDLLTIYATALGSLITQRRAEQTALDFQEKLRLVHDVTLELAQQESLVDVYRLAVELGRSKLGFDRLGLWVLNDRRDTIIGTFGIDENGQLSDERHHTYSLNQVLPEFLELFNRKERILTRNKWGIFTDDAVFAVDPRDWNVVATLWNGSEGVGWISADNYLHKADPRPYEFDLLTVYATAVGSLITQRIAEQTALNFQEKLRLVHDITLELSQQESIVDVYRLAVELGRRKLDFDRLGLWVLNHDRDTVLGTFGTDDTGQVYDEQHLSFGLEQLRPEVFELFKRKERILTRQFGIFKNTSPHKMLPPYWNAVATLWNGSEGIGWLSTDNDLNLADPRSYEFELLTVYATALGSLITQRWTEDRLKSLVGRLQLLAEIDRAILRSDSSETIAKAMVQPLKTLVQADYVCVVLANLDPGAIRPIAHSMDEPLSPILYVGEFSQRAGSLLDRGEVVQTELTEEITGGELIVYLKKHGMRRLVVLPMLHDAGVVGAIILGIRDPQELEAERIKPAQEVASQLSVALRQNMLYRQVQDYAESLEHKVAERTQQLEEKASEMEAFTYSVSHDLRAPLRAINGFSDLLMEAYRDELDEKALHYLDRIHANSRRMGHLIDALLELSRIGRTELRTRELDTHTLVQTLLDELQSDKQVGNAAIHLDTLLPCHADEALLKQVFINLISNAVKYSQKVDNPSIHIGYQVNDEKQTVYYVRDNGVGFDMKYADKLFGVFQRLHDARDYEGTGIGLATVQRIISLHSGKVWAEAIVNGGATFYFTLPENGLSD
jgi:PAS domain S-box-containing protein